MKRPLCQDCAFYKPDFMDGECEAPQNFDPPNFVDGTREKKWRLCTSLREAGWFSARWPGGTYASCGKEGRWFKPKALP